MFIEEESSNYSTDISDHKYLEGNYNINIDSKKNNKKRSSKTLVEANPKNNYGKLNKFYIF